jgi:hypothetical protein
MRESPWHIETRDEMGVPHPFSQPIQPVNVSPTDNGYTPLSKPEYSFLEDTGTSKTV